MSAKSDALERAATEYIQARTALDTAPGARSRTQADRAFVRLAARAAPRIRHFTRAYGLTDVAEDAAQACWVALHRAAERYDPARARFTTYVNWQLRAELQALRHRLHGDQRCAGRRRVTATLSLDALHEDGAGDWLIDPAAETATEQGAADGLAALLADRLVSDWARRRRAVLRRGPRGGDERIEARVAAERALVHHHLMVTETADRLRESDRHTVRRAVADIVRHAAARKLN